MSILRMATRGYLQEKNSTASCSVVQAQVGTERQRVVDLDLRLNTPIVLISLRIHL